MDDDRTRLGHAPSRPTDETQLAGASGPTTKTTGEGWLTTSGAIDHGRFPPGTVFDGRYRVIGLLGKGGMGEVYRADDLRLGQPVALKFLPERLGRDALRLAQFHNEVRTARQVSHKSVCRVYDIGEAEGHLFLSMEYVDGEDLASLLRRIGRLPEDKALEIARQICLGLAAAHERGVVHRDLKPANIMLDGTGQVRIMDFGLAAVGDVADVRAGTPAYMAPEQLEGREVTVKSDIYALGLTLYELFTGKRAFAASSLAELMQMHAAGRLMPPAEIVPSLDPAIDRAILRCLDADPTRRPGSAFAVAASLPGGDPLAAAIAAGETPSPEMVAAAGGESAMLSPAAGAICLALSAALIVLVASLSDRTSLLARVPMKPAAVLLDRAADLRRQIGYTDAPVDTESGFDVDLSYVNWSRKQGSATTALAGLSTGQPAAVRYWLRTSPVPLAPVNKLGFTDMSDPPLEIAGMTLVMVDTGGRLVFFEAAPPQVETPPASTNTPTDWRSLLAAAGLDATAFTDAPSARIPPTFADERHAWRGVLPGTTLQVTIEAAAYRGRPVSFEIVAPWTSAPRDPGGGDEPEGPGGTIVIVTLLVIASVLAHRNLSSGRADRRGAFRIGAVMFVTILSAWILAPHVMHLSEDVNRLFMWIGVSLFVAAVMYVMYLAIEPFARRSWPTMLVGWSRALAGRLRDPVVGRDVAIGVLAGLTLTLLDLARAVVPGLLGWTEPVPLTPSLGPLEHSRYFVLVFTNSLNRGLQNALIGAMAFTVIREIARRVLQWRRVTRISADMVAALIVLALFSLLQLVEKSGHPNEMWLGLAYEFVTNILLLVVLLRFGLLASVAMFTISVLTKQMPLTLHPANLHFGVAWLTLGVVFALMLAGVWLATRAGVRPPAPARASRA
jgi:predicted Ser/Thr protein kinase